MRKTALTERQQEIYEFCRAFFVAHWQMPSYREIGNRFDISSPNGVKCSLDALVRKGWMKRDRKVARGLRLTGLKLTLTEESAVQQ